MRNKKSGFFKDRDYGVMHSGGVKNMIVGLACLIAIASIGWAGFASGPRSHIRGEVLTDTEGAGVSSASIPGSRQSRLAPVALPGVAVILTPNGFQPQQLTRPTGKFVLAVVPQIGSLDFSFSFDDGLGRHLRAAQIPSEQPHWADVYDLPPGTYTLRELNHPEWVCQVTIKQ